MCLKFNFEIAKSFQSQSHVGKWSAPARPNQWKGGQQYPPATKCHANCMRPPPTYLKPLHVAHMGQLAAARALPRQGVGGVECPHPPSTVTPHYETPVPHVSPSINPDKTIRPYLLTTLSAFRQKLTYRHIHMDLIF